MPKQKNTYTSRIVGDIEVEKQLWKKELFNENNELVESNLFNAQGILVQKEQRKLEDGKVVRLLITDYDLKYETLTTFKYSDGIILEEQEHLKDGKFYVTKYTYNEAKELVSIHKIDESNVVLIREEISYENNIKLTQYFDDKSYIYSQEESVYNDSKHNISKELTQFYLDSKDEEQEIQTIEKYEYDSFGNVSKIEIYREDKLVYRETSEYIGKNLLAKSTIWNYDSNITSVIQYKYGGNKKIIREILQDDSKLIYNTEFHYDHKGSLIRVDNTKLEFDDYYAKYRETIVEE